MGSVINATRRQLYPQERDTVTIYRRLCVHPSRSGWVRKFLPPPGLDPPTVQPVASRTTTVPRQMVWRFRKINCKELNLRQAVSWYFLETTSDNQETAAGGPTVERGSSRILNKDIRFIVPLTMAAYHIQSVHPPIHPATCTVPRPTIQWTSSITAIILTATCSRHSPFQYP